MDPIRRIFCNFGRLCDIGIHANRHVQHAKHQQADLKSLLLFREAEWLYCKYKIRSKGISFAKRRGPCVNLARALFMLTTCASESVFLFTWQL